MTRFSLIRQACQFIFYFFTGNLRLLKFVAAFSAESQLIYRKARLRQIIEFSFDFLRFDNHS